MMRLRLTTAEHAYPRIVKAFVVESTAVEAVKAGTAAASLEVKAYLGLQLGPPVHEETLRGRGCQNLNMRHRQYGGCY